MSASRSRTDSPSATASTTTSATATCPYVAALKESAALRDRNQAATLGDPRLCDPCAPESAESLMSRFFKSAAFPILIVVVLAFFAQKLIGCSQPHAEADVRQPAHPAPDNGRSRACSLNEKDNTADVTLPAAQKYSVGYPDNYAPQLINSPISTSTARAGSTSRASLQRLALAAHLHPAVRDLHRVLDLPDEPGAGRRIEGDVVREIPRQAHVGRLAEDHLP